MVHGVSFDVQAREIVGVIGPNGAGKTTLLEALVGLRLRDGGSVNVRGRAVDCLRDGARAFAFLPDGVEPAPELTVRRMMAHALACGARAPALVDALERALRVREVEAASPSALSRGERARVDLFCALVLDRPVVVLDEPFAAFDPLQMQSALAAVRAVAESGAAMVVTVHHMAHAERAADRVLLLSDGRVVAFGAIDALRAEASLSPSASLEDVFVARLSGGARDAPP